MLTNRSNIGLPLAVWLAAEPDYDLVPRPKLISATSMQKPIRSIVLSQRMADDIVDVDIEDLISSKLGTAVHTDVEKAWISNVKQAMANLGYPSDVIDRVVVNPVDGVSYPSDSILVYVEKRTEKELENYTISGKFDLVIDGNLHDVKTTKVYNYQADTNTLDYVLQGSIYKWLNPTIITSDILNLEYLFVDWSPLKAMADSTYPQSRTLTKEVKMLSLEETESYLRERLKLVEKHLTVPQAELPECTPEELWQNPTTWAYYKDPNKTSRATKLFDNFAEAQNRLASDGNKGLVVIRPGEVKRCHWCAAKPICLQAESLKEQGLLK